MLEAESAVKAIAVVHALTLGIKIKEKIDLNEKYPVSLFEKIHLNTISKIEIKNKNPSLIETFRSVSIPNIESNRELPAISGTGSSTVDEIPGKRKIAQT